MTNSIKRTLAACTAACMMMMQGMSFPAAAEESEPDLSVLGAIGVFNEEETEKIATAIYNGLAQHAERISLRGAGMPTISLDYESTESLGMIFRSVVAGWDVGLLTNKNSMPYTINMTGVLGITPGYLVEDDQYDAEMEAALAIMDEVTAGVDDSWTDVRKAMYFHDYMADAYCYDYTEYATEAENYLRHTAYGMLKRETAVCEGYAWLYGLFLRRVGIDSKMVLSLNLNHAWNLLNIDGSYYHVDLTWDDVYNSYPGQISYDSFLKSNNGMEDSNHNSADWVLNTGVSVYDLPVSELYDYGFWNDSITTIEPLPDNSYLGVYLNPYDRKTAEFIRCTFDPETGESEKTAIHSYSGQWQSNARSYVVTDTYQDVLYFTAARSVFAMRNGEPVWLFDLTDEQCAGNRDIYGMYIKNGIMHYYVGTSVLSEAENVTEYTVNLADFDSLIAGATAEETTTEETTTEETTTEETTTEETTTEETTTEETTTEETTTEETTTEETTTEETTTEEAITTTTTTTTTEKPTTTTEKPTTTTTTTTTEKPTTTTTTTTTEKPTTTTTTTTTEKPTTTTTTTTTKKPTTTTTTTTKKPTATTTKPAATTAVTTTTKPAQITGDASGDGVLNVLDIIFMQRYLMGKPCDMAIVAQCDMTNDGVVDGFDCAVLKRMVLMKQS